MLERTFLPDGVRDLVAEDAALLSRLRVELLNEFRLWGYGEVVVPTLELGEDSRHRGTYSREVLYRLFDRKGRVLVLRPDMTESVARLAAEQVEPQLPLRYCYFGNAFRQRKEGSGRPHEVWQAGIELIGVAGTVADAEVVSLGLAALSRAGVTAAKACIGYPLLAASLNGLSRVPPVTLEEFMSGEDKWFCAGDRQCLDNLRELFEILISGGLSDSCVFDISLVREMTYYSGAVFEFYAAGADGPVAGGGRYDGMCSRFGRDLPATGLAIDVLQVMSVLGNASNARSAPAEGSSGTLIGYENGASALAQRLAQSLRKSFHTAEVDHVAKDIPELLRKAKARGRRTALYISSQGYQEFAVPQEFNQLGYRNHSTAVTGLH